MEGAETALRHRDYFDQAPLYDDGMFWYKLCLFVRAVAESLHRNPVSESIPQEDVDAMICALVDIAELTVLGNGGDMFKRNAEALSSVLWTFGADRCGRIALARARKVETRSGRPVVEFVRSLIREVKTSNFFPRSTMMIRATGDTIQEMPSFAP